MRADVQAPCAAQSGLRRRGDIGQQRAAAEAHAARRVAAGRDPDGAVLELRNLAERIEHRVGELVRGGLVVAERHEHRPARHAIVCARIERDAAAPGFERYDVTGLEAQAFEIERVYGGDGLGL